MGKGYVSEFMSGGRIVAHGKIADLTNGFRLSNGAPFSVYVRPKLVVSAVDTVINAKCYQDDVFSEAPVPFNDWSPMAIVELAPDTELLKSNDVYWGSGQEVEGGV